jgi:formylglycine-generating enzyme required for sulfatase activity
MKKADQSRKLSIEKYGRDVVSCLMIALFSLSVASAQNLDNLGLSVSGGLRVEKFLLTDSTTIDPEEAIPVFSFELNGRLRNSDDVGATLSGNRFILNFEESLRVTFTSYGGGHPGWKGQITFENGGFDTLKIENVIPFGENQDFVYITGKGPWDLARAWLHRPGYKPVRVILPDNAWETGFSSLSASKSRGVAAIARRSDNSGAITARYNTLLPPGSTLSYEFFGDIYKGEWQEALKLMFRDRYLYDIYDFDNSLYERDDLKWIRKSYLIMLQFAWDREFYDRFERRYNFGELIREANRQFGFLDVYGIWPTWPRLGVDARNQWDLYRDLPGGTDQLKSFGRLSRQYGTKFFIAYNPWDQSTRAEDHFGGMASLIAEIEADGVVLDTRGSSSYELQSAADSVREGVVMYSEGMAVIRDMPGIVSGRVHNAIFMAPELNLNKLIKSEFGIFRVLDVGEAPLHREIAVAFFNGYGSELNMFRPGRHFDTEADYGFLARTTRILRENSDAFLDNDWTPLMDVRKDGLHVNRFRSEVKTVYTLLNMDPSGAEGNFLQVENRPGFHWVSLWHNRSLEPVRKDGGYFIPVSADPYNKTFIGGRKEGSVDCIAMLPELLRISDRGSHLAIATELEGRVAVWKGAPGYGKEKTEFTLVGDTLIERSLLFGNYQGDAVIQLFDGDELADMVVISLNGDIPWLISKKKQTSTVRNVPVDMVLVPGTSVKMHLTPNDNFIPYPEYDSTGVAVDTFFIDRYPVTNQQYFRFITESGYFPVDTVNYLKHWVNGVYRQGQERYPVVWVSLEDARAYAEWAGKRLPVEAEWQLAAQGNDGRLWPWGDEFHGTKCNNSFDRPTPVDAFSKGESPYGVVDLVGNVWQLTDDVYFNGSYYFVIIRGGSHYKPDSSWWYVQGGPQPLNKTQMLQLVSPGFDRSSTVGFRCVKDYAPGSSRNR